MTDLLFVHPYFGDGGAEKGINKLSKIASKYGYQTYLACIDVTSKIFPPDFDHILRFPNSHALSLSIRLIPFLRAHPECKLILNQAFVFSANVIPLRIMRAFNIIPSSIEIIAYERLNVELFLGNYPLRLIRLLLYRLSLIYSDALVANSLQQWALFKKYIRKKPVVYVPNSAVSSHYTSTESTESQSFDNAILWIGRLDHVKRPLLALQTLDFLPESWGLVIIGHGKLHDKCCQFASSQKLTHRVKFLDRDSKPNWSSFTCLLSTSLAEGLPNVFIESLKSNLPIVTTYFDTGFLELFMPYWIYVSDESPSRIASTILYCNQREQIATRKSSNISTIVNSYYSDANMEKAFLDLLQHNSDS